MKKCFFLALLVAAAGTSHAQSIKAGTVSLGGNVGYYKVSNTQTVAYGSLNPGNPGGYNYTYDYSNSQFTIMPSVGYFVADNFAVGAMLEYNSQKQSASSTSSNGGMGSVMPETDPNTSLRLGLYAQYYQLLGEQFGLVGTLGGGYQRSTNYNPSNNQGVAKTNGAGYYAGLTPGIVFFPVPKLGLSASMGGLASVQSRRTRLVARSTR